uniref:Uncharacterized protein n=1 Tax=Plectus sambesii TaxID=2011161 RepID=A0A914XLK6_9BILA
MTVSMMTRSRLRAVATAAAAEEDQPSRRHYWVSRSVADALGAALMRRELSDPPRPPHSTPISAPGWLPAERADNVDRANCWRSSAFFFRRCSSSLGGDRRPTTMLLLLHHRPPPIDRITDLIHSQHHNQWGNCARAPHEIAQRRRY